MFFLLSILLSIPNEFYIVKEVRYTGKKNIYKCIRVKEYKEIDTIFFINNNIYLKGDTIEQ